jgi:hypothetical protein
VQVTQGAHHLHNSMVIDMATAAVGAMAGDGALQALVGNDNALMGGSGDTTPPDAFTQLISGLTPDTQTAMGDIVRARNGLLFDGLPIRPSANVFSKIGQAFQGPQASVTMDYRLDDTAMTAIAKDPDRVAKFSAAVREYLIAVRQDYYRDANGNLLDNLTTDQVPQLVDAEYTKGIQALAQVFDQAMTQYVNVLNQEGTQVRLVPKNADGSSGPERDINVGAQAVVIVLDANDPKSIEKAVVTSVPAMRAKIFSDMFDTLLKAVDSNHLNPVVNPQNTGDVNRLENEDLVAFALLGVAPKDSLQLHFQVNPSNDASLPHLQGKSSVAKGKSWKPIGGGLFNVDTIIAPVPTVAGQKANDEDG